MAFVVAAALRQNNKKNSARKSSFNLAPVNLAEVIFTLCPAVCECLLPSMYVGQSKSKLHIAKIDKTTDKPRDRQTDGQN